MAKASISKNVQMRISRIVRHGLFIIGTLCIGPSVFAAQPPGLASTIPASAKQLAQTDLTGHWVAQITEDWRWRMATAPIGDTEGVPLNDVGMELAKKWSLEKDNSSGDQCKAYGAGGIMRLPLRLDITWSNDNQLQVQTDAGKQIRLFSFGNAQQSVGERSWQGVSIAQWMHPRPPSPFGMPAGPPRNGATPPVLPPGTAAPPPALRPGVVPLAGGPALADVKQPPGSLKVVTRNLKAGYLRKNGIPYSENATVTEYYDRVSLFGIDYLNVVTVVDDPTYLRAPFIVSNQFKREPDGSRWKPSDCKTDPPTAVLPPAPREAFP